MNHSTFKYISLLLTLSFYPSFANTKHVTINLSTPTVLGGVILLKGLIDFTKARTLYTLQKDLHELVNKSTPSESVTPEENKGIFDRFTRALENKLENKLKEKLYQVAQNSTHAIQPYFDTMIADAYKKGTLHSCIGIALLLCGYYEIF